MYHNTFTPLQHLRKPPVRTGGLCWAVFARKADVKEFPEMHPATNLAYTTIQLKEGKTWYRLDLVDKDRVFSETVEDSIAGPWWKQQLNGYFGGNNTRHTLNSGLLPLDELIVIFQDRDSLVRMLGNEDAGATFRTTYNSGDRDSSRKRTVSISWEHTMPAPIYIGSLEDIDADVILPPFAPGGDFNNDFSDDFDNGGAVLIGEYNNDYNNDFNNNP